ncbi:Predicted ATPase (PP-loop superfamily) [Phaffia rhodozyma]|uniref:Diphthine--ammonia ligase n=1 Tax=Phaffia rhodozyma TaxID=264483 RepID=A0A0F7SR69_PHARH|nr:Predicted ATPase (PP-loop superfamily) [Phaffia rhodozyma]
MKVIGLLSGGKDSCFNLLECLANGHPPIAVAGLLPPPQTDELDSFMYQTVGLSLIPTISQALRLPLYTRIIQGKPINVDAEYGDRETEGDETEDLFELLKLVKENHPDAEAVSVGAILSSYQRIRVEHVCARLDLVSLAYLWQQPQDLLLPRMINSGLRAILVKVAGVGLKEEHLGKDLGQMRRELFKLNSIYGLHICGEGGEYETVTLDSPMFHDTIVLDETMTELTDPSPVAPVAHLLIQKASLQPKPDYKPLTTADARALLGYDLEEEYGDDWLDEQGKEVRESVSQVYSALSGITKQSSSSELIRSMEEQRSDRTFGICRNGGWISIGDVTAFSGPSIKKKDEMSLEEEVDECFKIIKNALHPTPLSVVQSLTVYIANMADFPVINKAYSAHFHSSPPARACVEVPLPKGTRILFEAIAFEESRQKGNTRNQMGRERRGLHVQGLSHWAPANIGPYSQAVIVNSRITLSGQIPMIPATLALPDPPSFPLEAALCLKHVRSLIRALKEGTGGSDLKRCFIEGSIGWVSSWSDLDGARTAWTTTLEAETEAENPLFLTSSIPPPTLLVQPSSLPRSAKLEWQSFLHTGQTSPRLPRPTGAISTFASRTSGSDSDSDDEENRKSPEPIIRSFEKKGSVEWIESEFREGDARWGVAGFNDIDSISNAIAPEWAKSSLNAALSVKVFYSPKQRVSEIQDRILSLHPYLKSCAVTFIPVLSIATLNNEWELGIVWNGVSE